MTPTTTATTDTARPLLSGRAIKKILIWSAILLILGPLAYHKLQEVLEGQPERKTAAVVPILTLACGEEVKQLPRAKEVLLIVPPLGDCWTDWQRRSANAPAFWADPDREIKVQWYHAGGKVDDMVDNPLLQQEIQGPKITGVRFKNTGPSEVRVVVSSYR